MPPSSRPILKRRKYILDTDAREAKAEGGLVRLSRTELEVLRDLVKKKRGVVRFKEFAEWNREYDYVHGHPVKNHVSALNKKFGKALIESVPGVGYRLGAGCDVELLADQPGSRAEILGVAATDHLRAHSGPALLASIANCEEKIKLGAADAENYLTLARASLNAGHEGFGLIPWNVAVEKARNAIASALACDQSMSSAYALRGMLTLSYEYGWESAEQDFLKAIDLNPKEAVAHSFYAHYLISRQEVDEALQHMRGAVALAPADRITVFTEPWMYLLAGRRDEALTKAKLANQLFPSFPTGRIILGWTYQASEFFEDAIEEFLGALDGEFQPEALASLGNVYALLGRRKAALDTLKILDKAKSLGKIAYVSGYSKALVFVGLGRHGKGECLDALELAYKQKSSWLIYLNVEPRWEPLRKERQFRTLVRKIGLQPRE